MSANTTRVNTLFAAVALAASSAALATDNKPAPAPAPAPTATAAANLNATIAPVLTGGNSTAGAAANLNANIAPVLTGGNSTSGAASTLSANIAPVLTGGNSTSGALSGSTSGATSGSTSGANAVTGASTSGANAVTGASTSGANSGSTALTGASTSGSTALTGASTSGSKSEVSTGAVTTGAVDASNRSTTSTTIDARSTSPVGVAAQGPTFLHTPSGMSLCSTFNAEEKASGGFGLQWDYNKSIGLQYRGGANSNIKPDMDCVSIINAHEAAMQARRLAAEASRVDQNNAATLDQMVYSTGGLPGKMVIVQKYYAEQAKAVTAEGSDVSKLFGLVAPKPPEPPVCVVPEPEKKVIVAPRKRVPAAIAPKKQC